MSVGKRYKMGTVQGPDQLYSWVIAFAACIINTMLSGISRATGIFYVALIDVYEVTRMEANLPFTLRNAIRSLAGPAVGMLGQHFGVRIVSVIGSIFAISGIAFCSLAPNIIWISILWGGLHGVGVALANTLFQVTVSQYFVKYRATAVGIALSGACVGSFVFPVALERFLDLYGLQGAFLMTGALIMHVLPASMLLKEPPWLQISSKEQPPCKYQKPVTKLDTIEEMNSDHEHKICQHRHQEEEIKTSKADFNKLSSFNEGDPKGSQTNGVKSDSENPGLVEMNGKSKSKDQDSEEVFGSAFKDSRCRTISSGDLSLSVLPMKKEKASSAPKRSLLKAVLYIYRNPMFHMISLSFGAFCILFDPLMTVIVDYIKDKGLNDHVGKYLISILSLGDLCGRLFFGWVTDKNIISIPKFMMLIQLIQGICFVLLPFFYAFEVLMCLVVLYGLTSGMNIVMFPILVATYLTSEQPIAIGCIAFFAGIISFIAPPLIGHFRDHEGSYDGMFYITGSLSIVVGLLWLLEPWLAKFTKEKTIAIDNSIESR